MAEAIFEHKNVSCQYSHLSNVLLVALRCSDKNRIILIVKDQQRIVW